MNPRKPIKVAGFATLFVLFIMLAANGYLQANTDSGIHAPLVPAVATPPGGTIPVGSTGIAVLHAAPIEPSTITTGTGMAGTGVTVAITSTTGSTIASTGITVGDRWSGSPVQDSTQYLSFPNGNVEVAVLPTGSQTPILLQTVPLTEGADNTIVLTGGANGWVVDTLLLDDSTAAPSPLFGKVRVVHVAPIDNSSANTAVDVVEQSGRSISDSFNGLVYRDASPYVTLPAGEYDWRVNVTSNASVVELEPFTLNSGAILTIYVMGDGTVVQPAGLMVINTLGDAVQDAYLPLMFE